MMGIVQHVFLLLCVGARGVLLSKVSDVFENANISPNPVAKAPDQLVDVVYGEKQVRLGTRMEFPEMLLPPKIDYDGNPDSYYTLFMIDVDTPIPLSVFKQPGQVLHWLVANIKGSDISSGDTIAVYLPPTTPPTTGPHRYVFLLYEHHHKIEASLGDVVGTTAGRLTFPFKKFVQEHKLGDPSYGNFLMSSILL